MPTTRAMAESQKRITRSMAAAKETKKMIVTPKAPPKKGGKSASKARSRNSAVARAPLPELQLSRQRTTGSQRPRNAPGNRTAFQHILSSDAEVADRQNQSVQDPQSSTRSQGSEDSRESWEKDIQRWEPGQRPPLKNHPYDRWNNRPTARYGKGGWRPPAVENNHGSHVEPSVSRQDDDTNSKSYSLRLRGGWVNDEDLGSVGSTVAYETDEMEVTDQPSSEADSKAASEQDYYFGDVQTFISSRGNEYFCEIDEDYLTDRFNLTGLNTDVQYYQYALDLVTDVFDLDCDDDMREQIEKSARHLYGLVHARYITTTRGLSKMLEKYKRLDFGKCPRVACASHPLLPTGLSDLPHIQSVKLYCGKCEDLYNPKSSRHATIDGAYFGTSFQNILFQVYPALVPEKSIARYEPRIYGFRVHAAAALERWQARQREDMVERLKAAGVVAGFVEEAEEAEGEEMDDEEDGVGE